MPKPSAKSSKKLKTVIVTLQCSQCKNLNYRTSKNKINTPDRFELQKYCKNCKKTTAHKETK